ncbi:MAG: hypothetical protein KKB03_05080 [Nanoarchaeota archaeon]|nr:hypothetical protein [Nanoarchaeota archaeon]MBU1135476.1 hypothetical protein [Nanoarchaeota archaeon]MBU2520583.1 hypothetical protein [Nanoarchaeota archaeon]
MKHLDIKPAFLMKMDFLMNIEKHISMESIVGIKQRWESNVNSFNGILNNNLMPMNHEAKEHTEEMANSMDLTGMLEKRHLDKSTLSLRNALL